MPEMPEVIDLTEEISDFFEKLKTARTSLIISSPPNEVFTSSVIAVEENELHIDQLMPDSGNTVLQPGTSFEIRVAHEGVPHLFATTPIVYATDGEGYPYHRLTMPQQIRSLSKRASYRIPFKLSQSPKIHVWLSKKQRSEAWIENICDTGAFLRLKGKYKDIGPKSIIECEMRLAGSDTLRCQAVVRHQHYLPKFDELRLGVEFSPLAKTAAKTLHETIMKWQRHNIRTDLSL